MVHCVIPLCKIEVNCSPQFSEYAEFKLLVSLEEKECLSKEPDSVHSVQTHIHVLPVLLVTGSCTASLCPLVVQTGITQNHRLALVFTSVKLGSCTTAPTCKRVSGFCFSDEHLWPALSHFPRRSSLSSSTSTTTKTIITKVVEETIWGQSRVCLPGVGVGSPPFFTVLHAGRVHTSTWRSLLTFTSYQFPASQETTGGLKMEGLWGEAFSWLMLVKLYCCACRSSVFRFNK